VYVVTVTKSVIARGYGPKGNEQNLDEGKQQAREIFGIHSVICSETAIEFVKKAWRTRLIKCACHAVSSGSRLDQDVSPILP
jgi:hypothetical protein